MGKYHNINVSLLYDSVLHQNTRMPKGAHILRFKAVSRCDDDDDDSGINIAEIPIYE